MQGDHILERLGRVRSRDRPGELRDREAPEHHHSWEICTEGALELRLPDGVRPHLKRPLGELFAETEGAVEHLRQANPTQLIVVGDIAAAELLKAGLKPDITVVDFMAERLPVSDEVREIIDGYSVQTLEVKNPAGAITPELQDAISEAKPPVKIIVEGEEDLATIPAVLVAPIGSVVAYGQPGEGVVMVDVTEKKKEEFKGLLDAFEKEEAHV